MSGCPLILSKKRAIKQVYWIVMILILFAPWSASADLFISHLFYQDGQFLHHPALDFVYHYGLYPAWIVVIGASFVLVASFFYKRWQKWQKGTCFLLLTLALGSGLIIHACFKDHWGRPRPKQIVEFGGHQPFHPFYQPDFFNSEPSKSFPCGHCSLGFYFFAVAFLGLHYHQRKIYYLGLILAWGLGGLLSIVRIAQGGHFFSDVLVSGCIMWGISLGLYLWLFGKEQDERTHTKTACYS